MPILINQDQLNLSALTVPAVYLVVEPPQASITGVPASVIGRVGTASWGPLNIPVLIGNLNEQNVNFGGVSAASVTDPYDMATDTWAALQQAGQFGNSSQNVRVSDGTDVAASRMLEDIQGNTTVAVLTGSATPTDIIDLVFTNSNISGSPVTIAHTVSMADSLATIATALKNAINSNAALSAAGITANVTSSTHLNIVSNNLNIIPTVTYSQGGNSEVITITPGVAVNGGTLHALYTGVLGNQIKISILAGTSSSLVNVLLTAWPGKAQEFYQGLPNNSGFWAALQSALANGIGTQRPSSQLARFTPAGSGSPQAPQLLVAQALSGGTDGRSGVTSSDLVGSPTGGANAKGSGMYALLNANPLPQQAWLVGLTDQTQWPTVQQFASANGIMMVIAEAIGTDVSAAVADLQNFGIDNYEVVCLIDWPQMYDPVNQIRRFIYPTGVGGGLMASLSPEQSPLNKQMQGVITTYNLQNFGPYSNADISLANTSGVSLFQNPIAAGPQFGFITAVNTSLNNIGTAPIEYTRLTNFLIQSVGVNLGQFLGKLQSQQPVDPVRSAIKSNLNSFLSQLESNGQLDAHVVLCEFSLTNNSPGYNTPTTIAQHICSVFVAATYLSSIWYLVFTLQGGTTVSVQNVVSPQPVQ